MELVRSIVPYVLAPILRENIFGVEPMLSPSSMYQCESVISVPHVLKSSTHSGPFEGLGIISERCKQFLLNSSSAGVSVIVGEGVVLGGIVGFGVSDGVVVGKMTQGIPKLFDNPKLADPVAHKFSPSGRRSHETLDPELFE